MSNSKNMIEKIEKYLIKISIFLICLINYVCILYANVFLLNNNYYLKNDDYGISLVKYEDSINNNIQNIDLENITYEEVVKLYIDALSKIFGLVIKPVNEYNDNNNIQDSNSINTVKDEDLPTNYEKDGSEKLKQPYIHPYVDDYFGKEKDLRPIHKVVVSPDDSKRKNKMCITFDSAYINRYTYRILDILDRYNVKSTFFMTADFIKNNPEQVKEIVKRGHEVGNHSTKHPRFTNLSEDKIINEVLECHKNFKDITGLDMCLFRYPYGEYSEKTMYILKQLGYYSIQCTIDSADWKNDSAEKIMERIENNNDKITEGSIILFHNGATYTPDCLSQIIEKINNKGLDLVRVSDIIYEHNFYVDVVGNQYIPTDEEREKYKSIEKKPIKFK